MIISFHLDRFLVPVFRERLALEVSLELPCLVLLDVFGHDVLAQLGILLAQVLGVLLHLEDGENRSVALRETEKLQDLSKIVFKTSSPFLFNEAFSTCSFSETSVSM